MTLVLDPDTRTLSAGPPPADVEEARLAQAILAAVAGRGEAEEREIHAAVPGRKALKVRALRWLVAQGRLVRRGRGRGAMPTGTRFLVPRVPRARGNSRATGRW